MQILQETPIGLVGPREGTAGTWVSGLLCFAAACRVARSMSGHQLGGGGRRSITEFYPRLFAPGMPPRGLGWALILASGLLAGCAAWLPSKPAAPPVIQEFQFAVLDHPTTRQFGRSINLFIRYRYLEGLAASDYPDYRAMRQSALEFFRVRPAEPAIEYWEVLNEGLVRELYVSFPLAGVVSQLQVEPDPNPKLQEPGFHSSIVQIGAVTGIDRGPRSWPSARHSAGLGPVSGETLADR